MRAEKRPDWEAETFQKQLDTEWLGKNAIFYSSIDSTNKAAKEMALNSAPEGTLIVSDRQTEGRGRRDRRWYSPEGRGLWFSVILRPPIPPQKVPQFTFISALGTLQAIQELDEKVPVNIKWPNDLLIRNRKVCGILTELAPGREKSDAVIVGIGLNVNFKHSDFPGELLPIATSLSIESGRKWDRLGLLATICKKLENLYEQYLQTGFEPIRRDWESRAFRIGREISIRTDGEELKGIFLGINGEGALLLQGENGRKAIYNGELILAGR
jgi:birA, biotin-[acetyl-CoA-carboxylase] ligase region